jgi:hypothetical protein
VEIRRQVDLARLALTISLSQVAVEVVAPVGTEPVRTVVVAEQDPVRRLVLEYPIPEAALVAHAQAVLKTL